MKKTVRNINFIKAKTMAVVMGGLLVYGCSGPGSREVKGDRFLQQVDLTSAENKPLRSRSYMLAGLADQGIQSGKIKPLQIDYDASKIKELSLAEYQKLLALAPVKNHEGVEVPDHVYPIELKKIVLDVLKDGDSLKQINYVHFWGTDQEKGNEKYYYSVSFPELANFLNEKGSLWVKNSSPLVWKNQILHTDTYYAEEILSEVYKGKDNYNLARFPEKKPFEKEEMEIYSYDYKLVEKEDYKNIAGASAKNEIKLMSEALLSEQYTPGTETKTSTSIPKPSGTVKTPKAPAQFVIIQKEEIDLEHPENRKFYQPGQELSSFLIKAYEKGLIKNIYYSDSLNRKMTNEKWNERISMEDPSSKKENAPRIKYTGKQASVIQVGWKTTFNQKGEITRVQPHSLTLWIAPRFHPTGIMYPVASFNFNEVEKALQQMPEYKNAKADMISDVKNRKYFAYLASTSGIVAANITHTK